MATIKEHSRSRSQTSANGSKQDHERIYHVYGTDDPDIAEDLVIATAPTNIGQVFRNQIKLGHPGDDESIWEATVDYKQIGGDNKAYQIEITLELPIIWGFGINGQTVNRTTSDDTTSYTASNGIIAPDFKHGIGFNGDGFDGADVLVPTMRITGRKALPVSSVTLAYMKTLRGMVGKTNKQTFYGFPPGEVMFEGATGDQVDLLKYDATFSFLISENETGLDVGGIGGIVKKGWQYLWVLYEKYHDTTAKFMPQKPRAVYVETVTKEVDFAALGIGTG